MRLIALGFAIALSAVKPAIADITVENAHKDRVVFERCNNALHEMSVSRGKLVEAVSACNKSAKYYLDEAVVAKTKDARCLASLYAGASLAEYSNVLWRTADRNGARMAARLGKKTLSAVVVGCPGEPNIIRAAKGILSRYSRK